MIPVVNGPSAESMTLEYVQQLQRNRNNSGGSFSSVDSAPDSPVFATSPVTAVPDIGALAMVLQAATLKDNLNLQEPGKTVGGSRYKTEMCRSFMETGQCKYGDKCQFAHGHREQRAMPRHPKYKTELCRTFHTTGLCPYGMRCHFIHNEDPMKLGAIMHSKQNYQAQQVAQEMVKQAASLRAQQQQLSALVSQVQQQLVTNIAMQNTVNAALHSSSVTPALPAQPQKPAVAPAAFMPRVLPQFIAAAPKPSAPVALRPTVMRDAPRVLPESPSVSPICGSPVFNQSSSSIASSPLASSPRSHSDVIPPPGFAPINSNVDAVKRSPARSAFDFSAPCAQNSDFLSQICYNPVTSSAALHHHQHHQSMDLDSSDSSVSSLGGYTPPSSPDSFCQSPVDSPRLARLPIFSQISGDAC